MADLFSEGKSPRSGSAGVFPEFCHINPGAGDMLFRLQAEEKQSRIFRFQAFPPAPGNPPAEAQPVKIRLIRFRKQGTFGFMEIGFD